MCFEVGQYYACLERGDSSKCQAQDAALSKCLTDDVVVGKARHLVMEFAKTKCPHEMYEAERCQADAGPGASQCALNVLEARSCGARHILALFMDDWFIPKGR